MKAWIRRLSVSLTSRKLKRKMTFGENQLENRDDFSIDVVGNKYMSTLKDSCTIKISNLTPIEVISIISGEYYDVEVKCGYKTSAVNTIFKGGVLYISNALGDVESGKTNTIVILCGSELVARYGQSRLNLSLNSGINMYSAINFVCKRAGIIDTNISTQFKKKFLQDIETINETAASWIDKLASNNPSYITNSDSINGAAVSLFDVNKSNSRVIKLTDKTINLSGGFPQLNKDGLQLSVMPTFNFMCGDIIEIDNSIIDISTSYASEISSNKGYYLDKDGHYMIYQMSYHLQNRGSDFSLDMLCKTQSLISNIIK